MIFFTFEYSWKQLQLRDWRLRMYHGCTCVYTGSFVLDYHALYLQHFMFIE